MKRKCTPPTGAEVAKRINVGYVEREGGVVSFAVFFSAGNEDFDKGGDGAC